MYAPQKKNMLNTQYIQPLKKMMSFFTRLDPCQLWMELYPFQMAF